MKVTCEYCGSYVEADENMKCPLCNAGLGSAVQVEEARVAQQQEEEQAREAELQAQEAKEGHISEIISGIANVATAAVVGHAVANSTQDSSDDERFDGVLPEPFDGPRGHRPRPEGSEGRFGDDDERRGDRRGGGMFDREGGRRDAGGADRGVGSIREGRSMSEGPGAHGMPGGSRGRGGQGGPGGPGRR